MFRALRPFVDRRLVALVAFTILAYTLYVLLEPLPRYELPDNECRRVFGFSPDGRFLATWAMTPGTAGGGIPASFVRLRGARSGRLVRDLGPLDGVVYQVEFADDGRRVAAASSNVAAAWDVDTGRELGRAELPRPAVRLVVADGVWTLCAGDTLVDVIAGTRAKADGPGDPAWAKWLELFQHPRGPRETGPLSPDGRELAEIKPKAGVWGEFLVSITDVRAGRERVAVSVSAAFHSPRVDRWTADGRYVLVRTDQTVRRVVGQPWLDRLGVRLGPWPGGPALMVIDPYAGRIQGSFLLPDVGPLAVSPSSDTVLVGGYAYDLLPWKPWWLILGWPALVALAIWRPWPRRLARSRPAA